MKKAAKSDGRKRATPMAKKSAKRHLGSSGATKKKKGTPARVLRFLFWAIFSAVLCWSCVLGAQKIRFFIDGKVALGQRLERVEIATTGTMPRGQVLQLLRFPRGISLGKIDVHRCRARLKQQAQVLEAHVERVYPNALRIRILERTPVLRIRKGNGPGWLPVAADGVVFEGHGLFEKDLNDLPLLENVSTGESRILEFVPELSRTLALVRGINPSFYATWRAITVQESTCVAAGRLDGFEIRCDAIHHLRLRCEDIPRQLEELEYVLSDASDRHLFPLDRVDLSIAGRAYVKPSNR
ncbi:MAG: FtsQ-type POTRA domain-containing protein [Puniceicoccales bacterium]|jgi:cell division septal protein FtsQ|nr:FtsQ-type POTRA domain-containing protein [Puniceicoccales bacterium]